MESRRSAFEAEALPHLRSLWAAARRLLRGDDHAEDLVQETYLRAYRTFDNFEPGTNCRSWLFTILYSVFINRYHRQRRAPESRPLDDPLTPQAPRAAAARKGASQSSPWRSHTGWRSRSSSGRDSGARRCRW